MPKFSLFGAPQNKNGTSSQAQEFLASGKLPAHIAIIMDGNGRWARRNLLPRVEGHRVGAKTVRMIVEECRRLGIKCLTLFSFSTENWNRPKDEVGALMRLFEQYLKSELKLLLDNDIRLRAIGDLSRLPDSTLACLQDVMRQTEKCSAMQLVLALSYGGREEIVNAARLLASRVKNGELELSQINEQEFRSGLYAPDIVDPDLLIRTSDENRISNFLLWELAYTEIVVSSMYWPEFSKDEFYRCLAEYQNRERRFGLTEEQLKQASAQ